MNKWKSKSFYIVLISAIIMLLQAFGLKIDVPYVSEIIYALCTIGVLLGVIVDDGADTGIRGVESVVQKLKEESENSDENEESTDEDEESNSSF